MFVSKWGFHMDAPQPKKPIAINRWLPYCAVFQADFNATLRSWVYRVWVSVSILAATGYLLYRLGAYKEAHLVQIASAFVSDLLRWTVLGSVTLIVVLAAGSISAERGTMADSILSRGISRHQYFLGKWHARLAAVLLTFLVMSALVLTSGLFFLHEDLSLTGSLFALATVAALLAAVVTCGVTVSAMATSTVMAIAVVWVVLYGGGFALSLLPGHWLTPDQALQYLPNILRGNYDPDALSQLIGWCGGVSVAVAVVGMIAFARRDV